MAANMVTGNEFKSTDFAITSGIGAGTGAIAPFAATTIPSAMALNGTANALTYEATTYANTGSLAFDEGLAWSIGTGAAAGYIGGRATPFNKITLEGTDEYANQFGQAYGSKISGSDGISFDPNLFPDQVSKGIWREAKAGAGRTFSSGMVANSPCDEDICQ
jgi:hypothetical protein